jgi:hypothetical protein
MEETENKELHALYSSANIIVQIKSMRMRWEEEKITQRFGGKARRKETTQKTET